MYRRNKNQSSILKPVALVNDGRTNTLLVDIRSIRILAKSMRLRRLGLLRLASVYATTLAILALASLCDFALQAAEKPNVVFLLADDMGWGDLHCHGNEIVNTPVLDKFASQSVELERFFVAPLCSPTRASLLTGRHHLRSGVLSTTGHLEVVPGDALMISEVFKEAGYRTAYVGKWHNGSNQPSDARSQGFERTFGFSGGFQSVYFNARLESDGSKVDTKGYITDVFTDEAIDFIEKNRNAPFFCYLPYNVPHSPMQVPDELFNKYSNLGLDPKLACIYGMVENLDTNIGRLLATLDSLGLSEKTLVVFTSDNGPNTLRFNGGMRGIKGSVFEGGTRVACYARFPAKFPAGHRVQQVCQHIDWFPTLCEVIGVEVSPSWNLDGRSLAPLLENQSIEWPDRMLFTIAGQNLPDGSTIRKFPCSVRSQQYRWGVVDGNDVLFDLENDPGERMNRAAESPELVRSYRQAFIAWFNSAVASDEVSRHPIFIAGKAGTRIELLAPSASPVGEAKFYGNGWDNDWLTGFHSIDDSGVWKVVIEEGGDFRVTVEYAADTIPSENSITVKCGEHSLDGRIETPHPIVPQSQPDRVPRIEVPEAEFKKQVLGTITLLADTDVQILSISGFPSLSIKSLTLEKL